MGYNYELAMEGEAEPVKAIIHSVNEFDLHWHNRIEIIFVLEGSVNIKIGEEIYCLKENDLVLVNTNELHSTGRTEDKNLLLALQINPEFYRHCFPKFINTRFHCIDSSQESDRKDKFNIIKHYIANIIWCLNKKNKGYELIIGSYLFLLGECLINNFQCNLTENKSNEFSDENFIRIIDVINYINENMERNVTLKEIAEKQHLNYYFLSHFIKDKIGMSFQEYLNCIRLNKAVGMLVNSGDTITNIAYVSGFSSVSFFNGIFKKEYNCSPTEYRENLLNSSYESAKLIKDNKKIETYLDVDRNFVLKKLHCYLQIDNIAKEGKFINEGNI